MSGAEQNNQTPAVLPDVSSEGGTQPKKGPRAPNLSTKKTMISERQERQGQLPPQNDYQARGEEMTIEKPKHGLNVTAQEFVPGKPRHVLSVDAQAFVPKGQQMPPVVDFVPGYQMQDGVPFLGQFANLTMDGDPSYMGNSDVEFDIILRFKDVLETLTLSPGNMEEFLKPLCEDIEEKAESPHLAKSLCDLLLQQSIQEENFRYTGARICQFLNNKLTLNKHVQGFAKMFINRCGEEFNRKNELLQGSDDDKRHLCGLAIFMAEIFLNVETKSQDGTRTRFKFMPAKLAEMIMTLLSVPEDMTVKCVCQLLKLVGGLIEDCAKNDENLDGVFRNVFVELQKLSESHISKNIKFLVQSVIELREKNWNRSTSPPKKEEPVKLGAVTFQQEPVFYNNGKECPRDEVDPYVLTDEEELAFLMWQAEQEGTSVPWDDTGYESCQLNDEGVVDSGWMGEDMEAAYEEFLQGQGQSQSQTYTSSQGASETAGFPRQVNTVISPPNQYQLQNEEYNMYSPTAYNNGNQGLYYPPYYDNVQSEMMNQMFYQNQPQPQPHPHSQPQPQPPYSQQRQQPPYDQSYQHQPPNSPYHHHR